MVVCLFRGLDGGELLACSSEKLDELAAARHLSADPAWRGNRAADLQSLPVPRSRSDASLTAVAALP